MSATELPNLDPANWVYVKKYEDQRPFACDPVGKTSMSVGQNWDEERYNMGARPVSIRYLPDLTTDLYDMPISRDTWDKLADLHVYHSVKLAETWLGYERRGPLFLGIVKYEDCRGMGIPGKPLVLLGEHSEDDPEYKFWPDNVPGRDNAVSVYLLQCLLEVLIEEEAQCGNYDKVTGKCLNWGAWSNRPLECGIAIDKPLANHIGLENFPGWNDLGNGLILVLRSEVRDV